MKRPALKAPRIALAPLLLAGCAALFSPFPAAGPETPPLRVASWNLAFLTGTAGGNCRAVSEPGYLAARRLAEDLRADVIAFQQVEDERAARRIFVPSRFIVIMERGRAASGNACAPRATGIAVRRGLPFAVLRDLSELRLGDERLSSGIDIALRPRGRRPLRLLAVNLAAGCPTGSGDPSCLAPARQTAVIARWMAGAQRLPTRYLVFGAWNRRLGNVTDPLWAGLQSGGRRPALAPAATTMACAPRLDTLGVHFAYDSRALDDLRDPVGIAPTGSPDPGACPVVTEIRL